jgi:uncharacterized membrane protein YeaQ/YmgE (transglycosylase-associated protein family)
LACGFAVQGDCPDNEKELSMDVLWFIVIGGLAGWIAGLIMKGGGFGILGDIAVGIVGGLVGGFLFRLLGLSSNGSLLGSLVTAVVGAIALIALVRALKRA